MTIQTPVTAATGPSTTAGTGTGAGASTFAPPPAPGRRIQHQRMISMSSSNGSGVDDSVPHARYHPQQQQQYGSPMAPNGGGGGGSMLPAHTPIGFQLQGTADESHSHSYSGPNLASASHLSISASASSSGLDGSLAGFSLFGTGRAHGFGETAPAPAGTNGAGGHHHHGAPPGGLFSAEAMAARAQMLAAAAAAAPSGSGQLGVLPDGSASASASAVESSYSASLSFPHLVAQQHERARIQPEQQPQPQPQPQPPQLVLPTTGSSQAIAASTMMAARAYAYAVSQRSHVGMGMPIPMISTPALVQYASPDPASSTSAAAGGTGAGVGVGPPELSSSSHASSSAAASAIVGASSDSHFLHAGHGSGSGAGAGAGVGSSSRTAQRWGPSSSSHAHAHAHAHAQEATLSQIVGSSDSAPGAGTTHSHSHFPANSTSANSSVDWAAAAAVEGRKYFHGSAGAGGAGAGAGAGVGSASLSGSGALIFPPGSSSAEYSIGWGEPIHGSTGAAGALLHGLGFGPGKAPAAAGLPRTTRSLTAGRDLRLKAHVQLGLAVPAAKAPALDPQVKAAVPESGSKVIGSGLYGTDGLEAHLLLGMPLPSPAETASLRHRAFLAQRRTQIRDALVRANVLAELDSMACESDRTRLRRGVEASAALWVADRKAVKKEERRRRQQDGGREKEAADVREVKMEDQSVDGPAEGSSEGAAASSIMSAVLTPRQQLELRTLLSSPGVNGKTKGTQTHQNALTMLQNETRHMGAVHAQLVANAEPFMCDWALATPAPGSYSSTMRQPHAGCSIPAVAAAPSGSGSKDTEAPLLFSIENVTAAATPSALMEKRYYFSARQAGAELGTFGPAWDVGPCGARLRDARELERCGWGPASESAGGAIGDGTAVVMKGLAAGAGAGAGAEDEDEAMMTGWGGRRGVAVRRSRWGR
ncbi:hypothetical protein OC835_005020 [Tilletia horrida]|nr:hypothetical protein OC835_005020 [Tilletia horrida]